MGAKTLHRRSKSDLAALRALREDEPISRCTNCERAEADAAAMREALEAARPWVSIHGGDDGASTAMPAGAGCNVGARIDAALAAGAGTALLARLRALEAWDDDPLPEDEAINAAFPTRTDRHDIYAEAMRLVGACRSKGKLVALVNWMLAQLAAHRAFVAAWDHLQKARTLDDPTRCHLVREAREKLRAVEAGAKEGEG